MQDISNNEITSKNQLIDYIEKGFKNKNNLNIGIEFEKIFYDKLDMSSLPYSHSYGLHKPSILSVLRDFNDQKWQEIDENSHTIGLKSNIGNISLEPGGQFEFSSIPKSNINDLYNIIIEYFIELIGIINKKNIGMYMLGLNPKDSLEQIESIPKTRYDIMYNYMPRVDTMGRNMMKQTCTLQANIDYTSENDLIKKMRLSMCLQPVIGALFANSPIMQGKLTGDLSHRMRVWNHTDKKRTGIIKSVFNNDFNIEKYIDFVLEVPMYFIYRGNEYMDVTNITFKDFITRKYKFHDIYPTIEDFELHLGTIFTDVRIKKYLEIRIADCPDMDSLITLPALLVGIFYDEDCLNATYELIKNWSYDDVVQLKQDVITQGLKAKIYNHSVLDIAKYLAKVARKGLRNRQLQEEKFLTPLEKILSKGQTMAEDKIDLFKNTKNIDKFIQAITLNR